MAPTTQTNEKKPKRSTAVKKVEDANRRNVTFSKRKNGLFNKLSELSILCHAEAALIIASPNGKLFSCGYPSADAVIRRFLTRGPPLAAAGNTKQQQEEKLEALRTQFEAVEEQLKEEKKKLQDITAAAEEEKKKRLTSAVDNFPSWWENPIDNMGLDGLQQFKKSMENLRLNLVMRAHASGGHPLPPRPVSVVPPPQPVTNFDQVVDNCDGWQQVPNGNIEFESGSTSTGSDNTSVTLPPFPPSFDCSSVMMLPPSFAQYYY